MGTRITKRRIVRVLSYRPAPPGNNIQESKAYYDLTSSRIGDDDPKYKQKIISGLSASNTLSAFKQRWSWTPGRVSWEDKSFPGSVGFSTQFGVNPAPVGPGIPPTLLAEAINKAAIGIRKKIDQETTSISGGVILAEIRETKKMLRHPADAIVKLLENFVDQRARNFKAARKLHIKNMKLKARNRKPIPGYVVKNGNLRETTDALAKSWLEFSFGVIPLMSDVAAIAEAALTKFSRPSIKRLTFTAQAASATSLAGVDRPTGSQVDCPYTRDITDEVSCRYTVGYKVDATGISGGLSRVLDQSGFDLAHVVPTIWEALPWSFFIDYFSNIGDVIGTNQVALTNVAWSQLTTRRNRRDTVSILCSKGKATAGNTWKGGTDYLSSYTLSEVKRASASIPFGELRFEMPGKDNQFKNMIALAWLQMKH